MTFLHKFSEFGTRGNTSMIFPSLFEVENSDFCVAVLQARMKEGNLPSGPVHPDVATFKPEGETYELTELLLAGFPCQARLQGVPPKLFHFSFTVRECQPLGCSWGFEMEELF